MAFAVFVLLNRVKRSCRFVFIRYIRMDINYDASETVVSWNIAAVGSNAVFGGAGR